MSENPRIVRLVTRDAVLVTRVVLDVDGRIPLRLPGVRRVAVHAQRPRHWKPGHELTGRVGVLRQRTVAGFAGNRLVPRLRAKIDDVRVTVGARGLPRVLDGLRADVVNG